MTASTALAVRTASPAELDAATLYRILRLRVDVFVVEQACPYPELDGRDLEPTTQHCWIEDDDGAVLGYLRVLRDRDGWSRIGRVVTGASARRRGIGAVLLRHALLMCGRPVRLDAQSHVAGWYASFGFVVDGEPFEEDGIPHVPMSMPAQSGAPDPRRDALRPARDASYDAQALREPISERDAALAAQMIGRPLRGESSVAVRCRWGLPAVLQVRPRLEDGTPFPTTFWLTCPLASAAVGRLEAGGRMAELNTKLAEEPELAQRYAASHERYIAHRESLDLALPRRVSAGGMPDRVKCLHALYGHHLATNDNPMGAEVAREVEPLACPAPCADGGAPTPAAQASDVRR